jgi:O-antigen/teichoic acid export membrane protein
VPDAALGLNTQSPRFTDKQPSGQQPVDRQLAGHQMEHRQPLEALFRPALVLMSGRFLGFVAAFAIPIVLARVFNQTEFGSYKQIFLVFGTVFGIAQVGMAESLYYFLPSEARRSGGFVFNTLAMLGLFGMISLGALWFWSAELASLLNNPGLATYIPLLGVYLLFMLIAVVLEIVMTVRRQHLAASCAYAASDLIRAVLYIVPVLVFSDMRGLMLGAVAFAMIRLTATLIYIRREFGSSLRPDSKSLHQQLAYAVPFGVAGLIEVLQTNLHLYVVSWHFDTATFAIYAVGCLQIPLADYLMTSTSNVMMVNMRERMLAGDHGSVVSIWLDSVRKLALIFFPMVAGLLITANALIVMLFTSAYERSTPIFMVWTLSMLFATLMTDGALRVLAETRFLILQNLLRLVLIIALIQWFLARFDLMGAILVTLLATAIAKVFALARMKHVLKVPLARLLPWSSLAITALIASAAAIPALLLELVLIKSVPGVPGPVLLLLTGLVYTACYYVLLQWCGPMRKDEKQMLAAWLRIPFNRLGRLSKPQEVI